MNPVLRIFSLLNQFIILWVFFHWFSFELIIVVLFIMSSLALENLLKGDLVGFKTLQFSLSRKSFCGLLLL